MSPYRIIITLPSKQRLIWSGNKDMCIGAYAGYIFGDGYNLGYKHRIKDIIMITKGKSRLTFSELRNLLQPYLVESRKTEEAIDLLKKRLLNNVVIVQEGSGDLFRSRTLKQVKLSFIRSMINVMDTLGSQDIIVTIFQLNKKGNLVKSYLQNNWNI